MKKKFDKLIKKKCKMRFVFLLWSGVEVIKEVFKRIDSYLQIETIKDDRCIMFYVKTIRKMVTVRSERRRLKVIVLRVKEDWE